MDSVVIEGGEMGDRAKSSVLTNDAFFSKHNSIKIATQDGIPAIINPKAQSVIRELLRRKKADKLGLSMVFTGQNYFRD